LSDRLTLARAIEDVGSERVKADRVASVISAVMREHDARCDAGRGAI
jgi:hypothetical protein